MRPCSVARRACDPWSLVQYIFSSTKAQSRKCQGARVAAGGPQDDVAPDATPGRSLRRDATGPAARCGGRLVPPAPAYWSCHSIDGYTHSTYSTVACVSVCVRVSLSTYTSPRIAWEWPLSLSTSITSHLGLLLTRPPPSNAENLFSSPSRTVRVAHGTSAAQEGRAARRQAKSSQVKDLN